MMVWLILLLPIHFSNGQGESFSGFVTDPGSGIDIQVTSVFRDIPYSGFVPIEIRVENSTNTPGNWKFTFYSARYNYNSEFVDFSVDVSAAAKSATKTLVYLPRSVISNDSRRFGDTLMVSVKGRGVAYSQGSLTSSSFDHDPTKFVVISSGLGEKFWNNLDVDIANGMSENSHSSDTLMQMRSLNGGLVSPADFPADRRFWTGVCGLWLSLGEWDRLAGDVRQNLLDWVRSGGMLFLIQKEEAADYVRGVGAIPADGQAQIYGLGQIVVTRHLAEGLNSVKVITQIHSLDASVSQAEGMSFVNNWEMLDDTHRPLLHPGVTSFFLIVFLVLIGPVNLWVWAPLRKRYRLVYTIPLISILFSILLLVVIIFIDGVGGEGERFSLVYLDGEAHRAVTWQEQVSTTALLLNQDFKMDPRAVFHRIRVEYGDLEDRSYQRNDSDMGGDWFESRRIQAHWLYHSSSTREQLIIYRDAEGDTYHALSRLPCVLDQIYWRDDSGNLWMAERVSTGVKTKLAKASYEEFQKWSRSAVKRASMPLSDLWESRINEDSWFYAQASAHADGMIETLPSINWENNHMLYLGPAVMEEQP
ncbi:MAG: hypothetical protein AAF571_01775 [Verrucomicrobiota bacterium]